MAGDILTLLRRDATPARCYLCENAYEYARQAGKQEDLCREDAFYDLYQLCVSCIEDETDSDNVREYVEPKLGRYVDYCAGFTSLTSWAAMATASATLASTADDEQSSATEASSTEESGDSTSTKVLVTASDSLSATAGSDELDQPASSTKAEGSSDSNQAWIAGPVVGSVVAVLILAGVGFWWYRRRKRASKAPSSTQEDQETSHFDKPQLHSECVPRPSHIQGGSTPPADQGHVSSLSYAEMPANEAPAHELSVEGRRRLG